MKGFANIFLLIVVVLFGAAYYFQADLDDLYRKYQASKLQLEKEISQLKTAKKEVMAPAPLRGPVEEIPNAALSVSGVVAETNARRAEHGLPPLSVNARLAQAAEAKVDDMFAQEYFAHESPAGEGPADLAEQAGYDYLAVGENLALGSYKDDEVLVQAWMDSPGHRENILHTKYTEIGVSVKRGTYEGRTTWLAVQEFGRPASSCPSPSAARKERIAENRTILDSLKSVIEQKREELENTKPKRGREYNEKVDAYNELIAEYNELLGETKALIAEFNEEVRVYNECIQ